jgi:hypothetical protein
MNAKITEADLTKGIRKLLKVCGIWHYKAWQGMGSAPGVSDIIGCLPTGRFFAIEIKTPRGVVSDHQRRFIDNVQAQGGIGFVARSVDDVIDGLGIRERFLV